MDDAALVRLATAGDRDAFAAIYDRYGARLHDFLCSVLRDREEAADIVHDTFVLAGSRIHQLRDPARLRPWLYAIARNLALRHVSRRPRQEPLGERDVTAAGPDAAEVASRDELAELVQAAANGLTHRDRVVLDLHLRHGLEGQDLADALGVTANHAYVLLSRLRDQVERSLGALLVARQGRDDCDALAELLAGWDGRFTTVWRKRVARHVDRCDVCRERRRLTLTPAALLGVTPAVALPPHLRQRVLDDVELCSHRGRPWAASRDGFPPPIPTRRRRRRVLTGAAALLLVVGATTMVTASSDSSEPVASVNAITTDTVAPGSRPATATTSPSAVATGGVSGTMQPGEGRPGALITPPLPDGGPVPASPAASAPTKVSPTTVPTGTVPTSTVSPTTVPTGTVPTTSTSQPTATTTTTPTDVDPPTITGFRADPGEIWAGGRCSRASAFRPQRTTATVVAKDASGIAEITLAWGGPQPGTVSMSPTANDGYAALVGPFSEVGLVRGGSVTVPLTVQATDQAGRITTARGSFILRCEP